jgi:hypothetical protein
VIGDIPFGEMTSAARNRVEKKKRRTAWEPEVDEELLVEITKLGFAFEGQERQRSPMQRGTERFFNFIEGPLWYEVDKRVYWHVQSVWCSVRSDYLLLAHHQFIGILRKALMKGDVFLDRTLNPIPPRRMQLGKQQ